MSELHTVNKSPFEKNSLETCLRLSKAGSSILLYEDAVYGALKNTVITDLVSSAAGDRKVYVLEPDLKARGLSADRVIEGVEMVDYAGFVDLVDASNKVQAWV
ncbi:MAG: sulfurtransferase complex subunit TusB [Gammaproteobacteria bacterium]|nr:MAG: sulfurtransferase complex subunit TusB [Gammaproteobacteria bacterium]RTZ75721.1 MAG: sulfurtransferase complex subunit TusB [Gammaproteobacteria bacterium]